jgi:hypothetical protein
LAIGNTWTYRVAGQDERFVVSVVGLEKIGDQLAFKLEATLRERVVATEYLLSNKDGIHRMRLDKDDIVPPLTICRTPPPLPLPMMTTPPMTTPPPKKLMWRSNYRLGLRYGVAGFSMTPDDVVSVPAGNKLNTLRIDMDTTDQGVRVRTSYWFAPKIGIVKQTIDEAKRVTTLELEKYELK